jgi:signal transduction histidine kinase
MTSLAGRLGAPRTRLRLPRRTARLRLTLLYGSLFTVCGAGLLGFTFWLFYRATSGEQIMPKPGTADTRTEVTLPPAACRHKPLSAVAACAERFGQLQAHAFDLHALLVQSGFALAVMAVLAFALGWLVAGRVLRPLRAITATARAISATSLHERLALAGPDDEFKELADTLDGLFARLEALLTLATSEAGIGRHEPADLAKVAMACLESAGAEARRRGLQVHTSLGPAPMLGDPDLITRLVANLVDNAVRHNVAGGTVEVSTAQRDGQAVLTVANSGPVIPPGEIGRLMQPFQRLAAARSSDGDGHGLGLPIVRAIATAHGAALTTHARPQGGLQVQVSFPAGASIARREPQAAEVGAGVMGL